MLDLSLFRNPTLQRRERGDGAGRPLDVRGLFYNSLFIQNILGYSALQTGATFLPMTVLIIWSRRSPGGSPIGWGHVVDGAGMALLSVSLLLFGGLTRLDVLGDPARADRGRPRDGITMARHGGGDGSVPVDKAGVGSAVINAMRQVGGSLASPDGRSSRRAERRSAQPAYVTQFVQGTTGPVRRRAIVLVVRSSRC